MKSQSLTRKCCPRAHFFGGSDARIIISGEEALIRPRHAQDAQMKSQRSFGVITGESRHPRAHAAQSSTAQAQFLRPIRGKYPRASHKQRQAAAKLPTFITGILVFIKAYAVLRQKLYARFSEHTFDQGNRVLVSRVAAHLDIRDRVSMRTGRLSQVPNRPIQRSTRHPDLCTCRRDEAVPLSHVTKSQP
jgi:hypothetical protein